MLVHLILNYRNLTFLIFRIRQSCGPDRVSSVRFSSDQFDTLKPRFSEVVDLLEDAGLNFKPHRNCPLEFGDGGQAPMFRKSVPDDRGCNV